jgi:hypothetical protein
MRHIKAEESQHKGIHSRDCALYAGTGQRDSQSPVRVVLPAQRGGGGRHIRRLPVDYSSGKDRENLPSIGQSNLFRVVG